MPTDLEFSQRIHQAILPVTERYVQESGHPGRVGVAEFKASDPLFDYTETHFAAQPIPLVAEHSGRIIIAKVARIPGNVLDEVLVRAFAHRADEIIEHRLQGPVLQLADHSPNQLPIATQFAGLLALTNYVRGATKDNRLRALIHRSHGIGALGYRPLTVRPFPKLPPALSIGTLAGRLTNTHYSIPSTPQYDELDLDREDRKRYSLSFATNLLDAMQPIESPTRKSPGKVRPADLNPECVMNPVGTKEIHQDGRVIIPGVKLQTKLLINSLNASIVPVYTAFEFDEKGKVVAGYCDVGELIAAGPSGNVAGNDAVDTYLTKLAEYRSENEDREVVYAGAA